MDHKVGENDSFFVRFNYGKFKLDAPQGQANCCLPTPPDAAARFEKGTDVYACKVGMVFCYHVGEVLEVPVGGDGGQQIHFEAQHLVRNTLGIDVIAAFIHRTAHGVDAAHLSGADADHQAGRRQPPAFILARDQLSASFSIHRLAVRPVR